MSLRVTVFGSSQPRPGNPAYEEAMQLGRLLGRSGHTLISGGYRGAMEAVSCGAAETGAHVVGITCAAIETWRPVRCNPWVREERQYPTLIERLYALIDTCDAALALPGGPGTLTEISLMWNLLLTEAISPRPLILIGPGWQSTFNSIFTAQDAFIPADQRTWLTFAADIETAVERINQTCQP